MVGGSIRHFGAAARAGIDLADLKEAKIDRRTLGRAWRAAARYHRRIAAYLATIALNSVVAVLPPLVFKTLLDDAIPNKDGGLVNVLFLLAIALAITQTGLSLLNRWFSANIGEGLIFDLRVQLYRHVQQMPLGFFTRTQTGALLSRMTNDVVGAQSTVGTLATVTSDCFLLVTTLVAMTALSWQVTLVALLAIPGLVVLDRRLGPRIAALSRQRMDLNAAMSSSMTERFNVSGALLVKLFGRPGPEADAFKDKAGAVRDSGIALSLAARMYFAALTLVGAIGVASVYGLGGHAVIDGRLTPGTLVALAALVTRLYSPLTSLASARTDLLTSLVSFERVFEVLDAPHAIVEKPGAVALPKGAGRIEVDHVWFRYPPASTMSISSLEAKGVAAVDTDEPSGWILRDVSFVAEPGTMTALVGRSGAGKTTLTSLIPRLYDVTEGAVRIDGHDVRDVTAQSLIDAIGVVSQDPHLFHDSIAANLRYARPDATAREIEEACAAARIHDVIDALPDRYDTVVGERGYRFSGGEKQRLAIARVLLKRPEIVILDEATSHLDSENEALVQRALAVALEGRTSVVIAHRLSTVHAADQILVVEAGRIVQRGTHAELLDGGGLYADLYQTQLAPASATSGP